MLLPIQESTFNSDNPRDIIEIEAGEIFYNAPRTANDRIKIVNADGTETSYKDGFLSFWTETTGIEAPDIGFLCANKDCPNGTDIQAYDLVGGHVVIPQLGQSETEDHNGQMERRERGERLHDGDRFCILPLCPKCNSSHNREAMRLRYQVKSPVLTWRDDVRTNTTERTRQ